MKEKSEIIVSRLIEAREAYYNSDRPIIGDAEFDALEDELRSINPNHSYFSTVGITGRGSGSEKIRHPVPMLSMGKAKKLQDVGKWLMRLNLPPEEALCVQPKIDGLSASLYYRDGRLVYVATRGDGVTGKDISHIAPYVSDIPGTIRFTSEAVEIRGELHLPRDTAFDTGGKPLRNNCAGLINRKDDVKDLHFVRFLAYQIIRPGKDKGLKGSGSDGIGGSPGGRSREDIKPGRDERLFSESGIIDFLKDNGFYTFEKWLLRPGDARPGNTRPKNTRPGNAKELSTGETAENTPLEETEKPGTDTPGSSYSASADLMRQIEEVYNEYISRLREEWNYETDGLIIIVDNNTLHAEIDERWVVDHHHHYALAFKPPSQVEETQLQDIIWQLSRQGNLTPVAVFKPVKMGGATLERASLHNADNVRRLKLSRGDCILVERANDVIPYVRSNKSAQGRNDDYVDKTLWPDTCPSCGSVPVSRGVHIACPNPECRDRVLQSILFWVRQADMEQIALKTLEALYDAGKLRNIHDLYTLSAADFEGMEGFGEKKIRNFLKQVSSAKRMSAVELISRLGIPMVQKKSLARLGINSLEDFLIFNDESYVIGKRIVDWKAEPGNLDFLNQLLTVVELKESVSSEARRGVLCLTGKAPIPRKSLIAALEAKGWTVAGTVTKDTVKVLCDDTSGNSAKLKKARAAGIEIVTYEDFLAAEGLDSIPDTR